MSIYRKIQTLIVETTYHSEVQRLMAAIKKTRGTPQAQGLRKQLDQAMRTHYQGMDRKEFAEFGASLVSTSKEGRGAAKTRKKRPT